VARQLITPPSQIPHTLEPTWRWGIAPTDDPDHKRAGYTRFKRSFGGQVKEYAGMWDLPIHAVKYSLHPATKTFSNTYM
jgi:lipid II:glycine glycyltransferase (peptidoglycan interpeptide bridge formation enzyme)